MKTTTRLQYIVLAALITSTVACHKKQNAAPTAPTPPKIDSTPVVTYPYTEEYKGTAKVTISKEFTPTQDDRGDSSYIDTLSFFLQYLSETRIIITSAKPVQVHYSLSARILQQSFTLPYYGNTDSVGFVLTGGELQVTWNSADHVGQYYVYHLTGGFNGYK